ncbi:hypothetical protein Ahy_A06g028285 [Arachis hypogaea]|uniref:Uncharacterized protein n=1 Tax=Arachis hypogaea TaxID=3818 RepID=A0A445CQQ2_ARAHY|nr:hypothetical protein Ahy_A06g028285 [Arachis hypogaea]
MYCPTCTSRFSWMDPGLWRCIVLKGAWIEVAMATGNGSPLLKVPPLGGENGSFLSSGENIPSSSDIGSRQLRTVFWVHNKRNHLLN